MECSVHCIDEKQIQKYLAQLKEDEKSDATLKKYSHDLYLFLNFLGGGPVSKERVIGYKAYLTGRYQPVSVNSMLVALNGFLAFAGWGECRVKALKIQRSSFLKEERDLSKSEYRQLLAAAHHRKNHKLFLLMETICSTGIRVSELRFITVQAAQTGRANIHCKGKNRTVFLQKKLCRELLKYAKKQGIQAGSIFVTRTGNPMDRSNIWKAMKKLCADAKISASKVFPHNLRHLFAKEYYALEKDLAHLADLLGHSNVDTTRIYTLTSGADQRHKLCHLGLVV